MDYNEVYSGDWPRECLSTGYADEAFLRTCRQSSVDNSEARNWEKSWL